MAYMAIKQFTHHPRASSDGAPTGPIGPPWNPDLARTWNVRIIGQDPTVTDATGKVVAPSVSVPVARLSAGPRSHRFTVVTYDPATGEVAEPPLPSFGPGGDLFAGVDAEELLNNHRFHAQNVYAIAARTLARFEHGLGRHVAWGFGSHQLYLVPHAFVGPNAYYADEDEAIYFGYFPADDGSTIYTALSHDIVAHETVHAILDGLRDGFRRPGLPDQAAFHEALADIVALLSVFAIEEVLQPALGAALPDGKVPAEALSAETLRSSVLLKLAEQMGDAVRGERGRGLRDSVNLAPFRSWLGDPAWEEPHARGEVLVAAVTQSLVEIWLARLKPLLGGGGVDRARAAEEGAKAADHLLTMVIRAIDYCPPLEFEFGDFLDAILISDAVAAPDDKYDYRGRLRTAFESFGIVQPPTGLIDMTEQAQPIYEHYNFEALRSQPDEVFRFLWENAELFAARTDYYTRIDRIDPSVRVGPDGFVVPETVVTYTQMVEGSATELVELSKRNAPAGEELVLPPGVESDVGVRIYGGGTIVFDQFGRPKWHQPKPLFGWGRQTRRLDYLVRNGLSDRSDRFGYSLGQARGQRFAELHRGEELRTERW